MKEKQIISVRIVTFILILIAFIALENVQGTRLFRICVFSTIITMMPFIRRIIKSENIRIATMLCDAVLIILIGLSSRYVINYYIYALYLLLMVEAGLLYPMKKSKYIIGVIFVFVLYNYGILYYYKQNWGTISEVFFQLLINVVIIMGVLFLKFQREEKENQNKLYDALEDTHEKLLLTNERLEKLTEVEVKNNIARDIHDTFGHDMMALIMEIEMADILIDKDKKAAKEMLKQAKASARNGMKTIRVVVETLRNDLESNISNTIGEMISKFSKRLELKVDFFIDDDIYDLPKHIQDSLYRLVQECLTNSVRHGEADYINIRLDIKSNRVLFRIYDSGKGSKEIQEGYGLRGMKERVLSLNGELNISGKSGFVVEGYIEVFND